MKIKPTSEQRAERSQALEQRIAGPSFPGITHEFFSPRRLSAMNSVLAEPYRQHGPTYAVINALAVNIAQVPFVVKKGSRKEPVIVEEGDVGGEWVELMEDPNPFLSASQFRKAIVVWLSLSGECMIVKESREDRPIEEDEVPMRLWPLNGKDFDPIINKTTHQLEGWAHMNRAEGGTKIFMPHEVIHVKYYNPYDPLRGLAPWEASQLDAVQDFRASIYNATFFENDATPGVVLVSQKVIGRDQKKDLQEAWENRHRGQSKRRRMAVLQGGLDIREMGTTHREMEFTQLKNMSLTALLGIYKVPRQELALEEHDNRATSLARDKGFWTKTLIPIQGTIEDEFWTQMTKNATDGQLWIEFDNSAIEALNEGLDLQLGMIEKLQQRGYTLNQANDFLKTGLPEPDPAIGDTVFVPPGLIPLESVILPESGVSFDEISGTPQPAGEEEETEVEEPTDEDTVEEEENVDPQNGTTRQDSILTPEDRLVVAQFIRVRNKKDDEAWRKVVRTSMRPNEPKFKRRYGNYLFRLREEQLKLLAKSGLGTKSARYLTDSECEFLATGGTFDELLDGHKWAHDIIEIRASVNDTLFDKDEWGKKVKVMHRPIYFQVAQDATGQVFEELGGNFAFDVMDPKVLGAVEKREVILANTNETIRQAVKKQLEFGVANGESLKELGDRVKKTFNFARARSQTIARTETAGATNSVRFETMEGEGVETHRWITARDEAVRFSHRLQEGKSVPIGKFFKLVNKKGQRSKLLHPNDPAGPVGEIINCRCIAVPKE